MSRFAVMHDADIFVKTAAGRDEIRSRKLGLPMSVRAILLMVDGQRTVAGLGAIIAGSKAPADVLDSLAAQGLIELSTPPAPPVAAEPAPVVAQVFAPAPAPLHAVTAVESVTAPPVARIVPDASPPEPPRAAQPVAPAPAIAIVKPAVASPEPPRSLHFPRPAPRKAAPAIVEPQLEAPRNPIAEEPARSFLFDGPLDLTLPTITGHEETPGALAQPAERVDTVVERYEHLHGMMNDIVRDFLAPHRRFFFQLKIERASTVDDLLELLHDLQAALTKARGDAFASDVVARLRNAAL